jgi:hypothetical protein
MFMTIFLVSLTDIDAASPSSDSPAAGGTAAGTPFYGIDGIPLSSPAATRHASSSKHKDRRLVGVSVALQAQDERIQKKLTAMRAALSDQLTEMQLKVCAIQF